MLTTTLYGIAVRHTLPEYVKSADMSELLASGDDLHLQSYADIVKRQYPLHTKAACVMSAARVSELPESIQRQRCVQRIKQAAAGFGITEDVESVLHPRIPSHDPAMFAWNDAEGNALPIKSAADMQQSAEWLLQNRHTMSLDRCRQIAGNIIKRADAVGVKLAERQQLQRICGQAAPDLHALKLACEYRARYLQSYKKEASAQLRQLAELAQTPEMDVKQANVVVNALDDVDGQYNLRHLYKQGLPLPESGFGATLEELELLKESMVITAAGDVFEKEAFSRITTTHLAGWMGEGFLTKTAEEGAVCTEKLATEVARLDRVSANRFARMAADAGVTPLGRVAPPQPIVV